MRRLLPVLALATLSLGAFPAARAEAAAPVERTIEVGRATRTYLISVPASWDRKSPVPVVFVWHGAGSDSESMVRATGFDAMAEASHAVVVYPRAAGRGKRYDVDPPAGRTSEDVLLFDALLARLKERFPVDEKRVYATGFSNGAALCYRLAADRPNAVAAIAPVAGYMPSSVRAAPAAPVPLLHVHGSADVRVGAPALKPSDVDAVSTWAKHVGATKGPEVTTLSNSAPFTVRRSAWTGPTPRSDAALLLFEGEGHTWPGGAGGVASREVWAFFRAHAR